MIFLSIFSLPSSFFVPFVFFVVITYFRGGPLH
jgi:hypothetical protein